MASGLPRILYFVHDNPAPSGGVWTMYSHVALLNRNGIPAFAVHYAEGFKPEWFAHEVPTIYSEKGLPINPDDILVLPENYFLLPKLKEVPVRKVIFCQNHFYAFGALPPGESWRTIGITHVFAGSDVIADFITRYLGWSPVPVVHYAVDHGRFMPGAKKRQIAYMPRKRPHDAAFIRGVLDAGGSPAAHWPWIAIDNLSLDRSAEIINESEIFLSLSELEGFGLPPVEAMASGCVVTGYRGYGGLEYATSQNGFWCEDGNPLACAHTLMGVADLLVRNEPAVRSVIDAGIQTASRYTSKRQETELLAAIRGVMEG